MKHRLRSPSLFITFAGAFLGVLIVGTVIQVFVVVRLVGSVRERVERGNAEALVEQIAQEIALELTSAEQPNVVRILDAHPARPDSLLLVFRDNAGRVVLASNVRRRAAFMIERLLSGEPFDPSDLRDPRLRNRARDTGPVPGRRRPRRTPPPGSPDDDDVPQSPPPPPPPGRSLPRPQVIATADVHVGGRTEGRVMALRRGPPPGTLPSLARDSRGVLLFLPLAILLAGAAGLLVFRNLLGRLSKLETLTARVAEGDLDVRIPDPGVDEIGRLGTALNRMTERLAVAKGAVDETHRQRRQLFADISHELATPLTSIRGYTETLLNQEVTVSSHERDTYLEHILDASKRMGFLIDDLLDLTRLESGTIQLAKERLNWTKLCLNTLQRFEPRFRDAGLAISWRGPQADAWVDADGRRMEQVIDNLMVNTLRYVPSGGRVTLELEAAVSTAGASGPVSERGVHRLVVADDGPGFPTSEVEHVFDRFFRGHAQGRAEGTGLGLAIVREIVQAHGGNVSARNGVPCGAVIEIVMPASTG